MTLPKFKAGDLVYREPMNKMSWTCEKTYILILNVIVDELIYDVLWLHPSKVGKASVMSIDERMVKI